MICFFEKIPMADLVHKEINVPDILDTPIINSGSAVEIKHKKKLIQEYKKILGESVRYPKLIGLHA